MQTEKELEKEMGDAGDDAEVLDEKMWFGEDEGEEPEDNEQRKDAGTTDTKSNSKGDEDTRKLVAGDREEQEDEKEDPDQDENAQVRRNLEPFKRRDLIPQIKIHTSLKASSIAKTMVQVHRILKIFFTSTFHTI